ncbi:MAG: hypothetical protein AAGA15_09560 [Pseudomonadota bacterium]
MARWAKAGAMTPDFALHFSVDGITLDQRVGQGWATLGTAQFASGQFAQDVEALREKGQAAALASGTPFATKLVLPNDQVKDLTLRDGNPTETSVALALEGATPYALADLAFDWKASAGRTAIAAVARETLEEAEAFAAEHKLNPAAFIALPKEGWDGEEAFFGPAFDTGGQTPVRDPAPYQRMSPEEADATPASVDAEPESSTQPPAPPSSFQKLRVPQPGPAPALGAAAPPATPAEAAPSLSTAPAPEAPEAPPVTGKSESAIPEAEVLSASLRPGMASDDWPAPAPPIRTEEATLGFQSLRRPAEPLNRNAGPLSEREDLDAGAVAAPPRNKPRFLALILTIILILALLAVAALAAVNENAIARLFEEPEVPSAPEVDIAALEVAEPLEEAPEEAPVNITPAALNPPQEIEPDTLAEEGEEALNPGPLTQEEIERFYAATGIWKKAPAAPVAPLPTELESFYVTSIDQALPQQDPVSLASDFDVDLRPKSEPLPPGPEVTFRFDADGLLVPSEDGALSPLGYTLFAGQPPLVPPLRRADEEATAPDASLAGFRPRARPATLGESTERLALGGYTRDELAAYRPRMRPAAAKAPEEVVEEEGPPSEFAVRTSQRPEARPRNFDRIVASARASQPSTVAVAAPVAPRTTQPSGPTRATVARAATTDNVINLRRVNLIGVYGTPSNRSALVRLANGRFVKVQVGDRMDGGRVAAISESAVRYVKGGRNITLEIPAG